MGYIAPNSTVVFLTGVSLSPDYNEGTVKYTSLNAQYTDMYNHKILEYDHVSYIGKDKQAGMVRIECTSGDDVQKITYMMFKNNSFENKWFYAFVTNIVWVNNVTWEIYFQLDVMQTYQFDYHYNECFIDRMHTVTDGVGDNIIDEGLETGEYIANYIDDIDDFALTTPVICTTLADDGTELDPSAGDIEPYSKVDGVDIGGFIWKLDTPERMKTFFNNASSNPDGIIDFYMVPKEFATNEGNPNNVVQIAGKPEEKSITVQKPQTHGKLYSYTPRNKKLYTFPYCYLRATDLSGNTNNYRYEMFDGASCVFNYTCTRLPNPEGFVYPENYGGIIYNYDEGLSINDFPRGSYVTDTYKAWLAQTANTRTLQALGVGASIGASIIPPLVAGTTGGIAGMIGAGALEVSAGNYGSSLTNFADRAIGLGANYGNTKTPKLGGAGITGAMAMMSTKEDHRVNSQRAVGNKSSNAMNVLGNHLVQLQSLCIQPNYAQAIDSYFDKYGYKINAIGVPNPNARPHWTYIKTVGCSVNASLPSGIVQDINAIHDAGITFWKSLDEIGNYSLDNRVS